MQLRLSIIKVKIAVCKFFEMFPIYFAMKMPVYKPEGNNLARIVWLKIEPGDMDLRP